MTRGIGRFPATGDSAPWDITAAQSLLRHDNRWWLYYGAADRLVCLAFG